jgi:hypothetical protein
MGVTDNLAPLFDPGEPAVRFRQGTITAWDAATGSNTVDVAGGTLTDVPILNTGEAIALKAGHVVCLLGQGMSWFIIGRVTPPNDPSFAGASLAFAANTAQATNFALGTTLATKVSTTLAVPAWADEAAVIVSGSAGCVNQTAAADFTSAACFIDGDSGPGIQTGHSIGPTGNANQYLQVVSAAHSRVLVPSGGTITCEMKIRSVNAAWSAHATNSAGISALAVFRSTT